MNLKDIDLAKLHDIWANPHLYGIEYPEACANWRVFADTVINNIIHTTDAMQQPAWLEKVKGEISKAQPSTLQEGRTEFKASTMTEPKLSGKFKKYAFTCQTRDGMTVNLSVSASLLGRILAEVGAGHDFAITKQGTGINTDYVVEAVGK